MHDLSVTSVACLLLCLTVKNIFKIKEYDAKGAKRKSDIPNFRNLNIRFV